MHIRHAFKQNIVKKALSLVAGTAAALCLLLGGSSDTAYTAYAADTETAPTVFSDITREVYAKSEHVNGLQLDPTDTDGVCRLKGIGGTTEVEYHNGLVLTFDYIRGSEKKYPGDDGLFGNFTIKVYDMKRGLLLGKTDSRKTGYFCYETYTCGSFDDGFYACTGNTARILDIGMNVRTEFRLPVLKCDRAWISSGGDYILFSEKGAPTKLCSVKEKREIPLSRGVKASCVLESGENSFEILDAKGRRYKINADGSVVSLGKVNMLDYYFDTLTVLGNKVVDLVPAGICIFDPVTNLARLSEYQPHDLSFVMIADDRYICFADKENKLRLIDTETGMLSDALGSAVYSVRGRSRDGSFVFADLDVMNNTEYYLATPSKANYVKKVRVSDVDLSKDEYKLYFKPAQPNSELAALYLDDLYKRYNVRVFFKPYSDDETYFGYYCKPFEGDQAPILEGLRNFLSLSPPQMLTEAADNGEETWILISSEIVNDPTLTSYGTAGFASRIGFHPFAALQTPMTTEEAKAAVWYTKQELNEEFTGYIINNFSHEFIHLLDWKTDPLQLDEWMQLSPKDAYFGTYDSVSSPDANKYYSFSKEFDDSVYFTDKYGRVNDLEDKARIGENLYLSLTNKTDPPIDKFARSESLYRKAEALCRILRENYPCLAAIPKGEWYLEKPLMGSYKKLKKHWLAEKNG